MRRGSPLVTPVPLWARTSWEQQMQMHSALKPMAALQPMNACVSSLHRKQYLMLLLFSPEIYSLFMVQVIRVQRIQLRTRPTFRLTDIVPAHLPVHTERTPEQDK